MLSQSKELEKSLENNHYSESFIESKISSSFHNIKIILFKKLNNDQSIFEGAKLFSKFNYKSNKELNFIFSSNLINNFQHICSNFLFGFLVKSYSFSKYKKSNKKFQPKIINIFNSKNRKLKNFGYFKNILTSIK